MKHSINKTFSFLLKAGLSALLLLGIFVGKLSAQDDEAVTAKMTNKPVKDIFEGTLLLNTQTSLVPIKGTFEMDIQHRFGVVSNGFEDLWGLYAPSNIRLGFNYAPISKLYIGFGLTKERMAWDFNAKYALLQQMKSGGMPVSVTYFGNFVVDGRDKANFGRKSDRLSFFHQVIIARKITGKLSVQVAPSLSYYNNVPGFLDDAGVVQRRLKNTHYAVSALGRFKVTEKMAVVAGFNQAITQHPLDNPYPDVCFGIEITTSAHSFQVFAGNYSSIVPQQNNLFNQNDYKNGQFLVGFNISRLWNF